MRFTTAAVMGFAASALADTTSGFDAMSTPTKDEYVPAGETYSIVWAPGAYTGSVTLSLLGGADSSTLQILNDLATVDNSVGAYSWAVDSTLGSLVTYGIKITLDSNTSCFQYSFPFHISTSESSSSETSASATATAVAVSSGYAVSSVETTSSAAVATTSSYSEVPLTTAPCTTTAVVATGNLSTIAVSSTIATYLSSATAKTTTAANSTTPVTVNGAPRAAAGSVALLGAIGAAIFAL